MRAHLEFIADKGLKVPISYNYPIQSLIYNSISPKLAEILHNRGFPFEKRKFKLFTFSRILGQYRMNRSKDEITFASPFRIIVSSVIREFIQELAEELIQRESVRISSQPVALNSAEISDILVNQTKVRVKMLSPITIYSTLLSKDGKKKTYYYSPFEKEFSSLLAENTKKKFEAFYGKTSTGEIGITSLRANKNDEKILSYKGTVIKGWTGIYELSGDPELIKLVYDVGLGAKNSQGFGCFEILRAGRG